MRLKNVVIYQLDGSTPAPVGTDVGGEQGDLTLARVLINACLAPDTQNGMRPVQAQDSVARFDLATTLYKTAVDQYFDAPNSLIAKLETDILRLYAPMVSGQIIKLFESAKADRADV